MKFLQNFTLIALLLVGLSACDIVEEPVCLDCQAAESENKVLVEDFTGHRCGNCPRAHEQLEVLQETYGENMIVLGVHAGGFANLLAPAGYTEDYKTPMGNELESYYDADNEGLPVGMINRRTWPDGKVLQKFASWGSQISTVLNETPRVQLALVSEYNSGSATVEVTADLTYFEAASADHQLVLVITEDSIYSKQTDYDHPDGYIPSYHHKHMLRASITQGTWGEQIKSGAIAAGEEFTLQYQIAWNTDWDLNHCHVVGYVLDNSNKEIWQAQLSGITD